MSKESQTYKTFGKKVYIRTYGGEMTNPDYSRGSFDAWLRYALRSLVRRTECTPPQSLAQALPVRQNSSREINRLRQHFTNKVV